MIHYSFHYFVRSDKDVDFVILIMLIAFPNEKIFPLCALLSDN